MAVSPQSVTGSFPSLEDHLSLRRERDYLKAIMDNSTAVIYLKDLTGRYLFINHQYEVLFHISQASIVGKTDFDIFPKEFANRFHANDLQVLAAGKPMEWEEIAPHEDGPHTYISLKFPLQDAAGHTFALCGISSDITQWKKIEDERNRFFTLTLDMLCVADFAGYFLRVNPSWEKTLGWSAEELVSRPYVEFVHPDDRAATMAESQKIQAGTVTISFENRYLCKDGGYKWLLWNAMPLMEQKLIYAAARDITQRKETEAKLAETADQLQRAFAQAQQLSSDLEITAASERKAHKELKKAQSQLVQTEKLVALGQMVAGLAHEINNPLAYILNNMAVLDRDLEALRELLHLYQQAEPLLEAHQPELFSRLRTQTEKMDLPYTLGNLTDITSRSRTGLKRIQQIVRDLRDFGRLTDSELLEVDLNAGIAATINLVQPRASQKKVTVEFQPQPLPLVQCQPAKIYQVVMNLVANAIDACPPGGHVHVRTQPSVTEESTTPFAVEIHILDNGSGIDPAILSKIFDPFFTTKPPGQGTGLGLSISHSIVEEHGGRIDVESTPRQGSHFTIHLPAKKLRRNITPQAAG